MRLSSLLGMPVRTAAGVPLGRVHDVRAELRGSAAVVTGLVVGELGLLERLGIGAARRRERLRGDDVVPWEDVVQAGPTRIVVRDREVDAP